MGQSICKGVYTECVGRKLNEFSTISCKERGSVPEKCSPGACARIPFKDGKPGKLGRIATVRAIGNGDIVLASWHEIGFYAREHIFDCRELDIVKCPFNTEKTPEERRRYLDTPMWPKGW